MFAVIARFQFGLKLADLRQLPLGVVTLIELSLLLSLVSGILGSAFVSVFLCWPILAVTRANNLFFAAGERLAFKLAPAKHRLRGVLAYAIELGLFVGAFYGARALFLRLGVRL